MIFLVIVKLTMNIYITSFD